MFFFNFQICWSQEPTWALPIRPIRVTITDTHMNMNVFFFVTMYNQNAFVVLFLNRKRIFFSTTDKFNCPITLPHKKEWRVKSKSSVKTDECGIFMRYDFYTIFYPNDYYLFSFKKRFRAVKTKRRKTAKI